VGTSKKIKGIIMSIRLITLFALCLSLASAGCGDEVGKETISYQKSLPKKGAAQGDRLPADSPDRFEAEGPRVHLADTSWQQAEVSPREAAAGTVTRRIHRPGIFASNSHYYELNVGDDILKFHFGADNAQWGMPSQAVVGDFDGDGLDTVAKFDLGAMEVHLATVNDTDEFGRNGTKISLTDFPRQTEVSPIYAVAGDWNGDGVDGLAIYHPATNTFYLRGTASTGSPEYRVVLPTGRGFPQGGKPVAGDFDGDGDDELGLVADGTAYLSADIESNRIGYQFDVPGNRFVTGDWDGDGVETLASFDVATNRFHMLDRNGDDARITTSELGHAEPGFWLWQPIAGAWQVPAAPRASQGYDWPRGTPRAHGFNPRRLEGALIDGGYVGTVQSVLVVRSGKLIGERYYHGFDRHIAGNVKSVSKSVLSALYGIAFKRGALGSLDDTVADYLPGYFEELGRVKRSITIEDIMTMRAGLRWNGDPESLGPMLSSQDYTAHVLNQPLTSQPGTTFKYSTGLTHVGSALLTEATGVSTRAFARRYLLEPLGISIPRWSRSPEGYFVGGAEMWMRPRDLARFGQLFLRNGSLGGRDILEPEWVTASANPWVPEGGRRYGLWWRERNWSHYQREDSYFAWGHGGQFLFLFPAKDLLVVVTSKWTVNKTQSLANVNAVFSFVDRQILTALAD